MSELNKASLAPVDNLSELADVEGGGFWSVLASEAAGIGTGVGVLLTTGNPALAIAVGVGVGSYVLGATVN